MSEVMRRLQVLRGLGWSALIPAVDHAIVLAEEAEALADLRSHEFASYVEPPYPPLVVKLSEAVSSE